MLNSALFTSDSDLWSTPDSLFKELNLIFQYNLDASAIQSNAKCLRYWSPLDNGLKQKWEGNVWLNPPYSNVSLWIKKASEESIDNANLITCLVPSRTDTKWFQSYGILAKYILFIKGRLKFGNSKNSAPFPSCLLIYGNVNDDMINKIKHLGQVMKVVN